MQRLLPLIGCSLMFGATTMAAPPAVDYEKFATSFNSPVMMMPYGTGKQAFLVVDQIGMIYFLNEKGGTPGAAFLDLRNQIVELKPGFDERGLLGLAFHPDFVKNNKFYVYYSAPLRKNGTKGFDHTGHISEFQLTKPGGPVNLKSERILLQFDEPQWNHNGGHLTFGPDGFLYLGLGDGGAGNDHGPGHEKGGNAQFLDTLLGKILRIDVDGAAPYGIPKDNPLIGKKGRDEIYAWGIRNPWGLHFDPKGNLLVADVDQNRFEEINVIENGKNYGWPRYEGLAPFNKSKPAEVPEKKLDPMPKEFTAPALVYSHNASYGKSPGYGISVTGGHVYTGRALPGLQGAYLFADYVMSWNASKYGLYTGTRDEHGTWTMQVLPGMKAPADSQLRVVGFGQDRKGETYVLVNGDAGPKKNKGAIWKIVPGRANN